MEPAELGVLARLDEDVEQLGGRRQHHRPVVGLHRRLEVLTSGVELTQRVLGTTETHRDPRQRVGWSRFLQRPTKQLGRQGDGAGLEGSLSFVCQERRHLCIARAG